MPKKWNIAFLYSIKLSKNSLKLDNVEVNEKEFHDYKQPIALDSVLINNIIVFQVKYLKNF